MTKPECLISEFGFRISSLISHSDFGLRISRYLCLSVFICGSLRLCSSVVPSVSRRFKELSCPLLSKLDKRLPDETKTRETSPYWSRETSPGPSSAEIGVSGPQSSQVERSVSRTTIGDSTVSG
jgi:predicted ATPase with chaperone activity